MAIKIGEALVKDSMITREQLRAALERQVIFGGRIGTNLVESGAIKENELSSFLSRLFKVPAVKPEDLDVAERETIACLTRELADKYKAVPFRKDRKRLHVAMLDPHVMTIVDELRFVSGYQIVPYVASELRLLYALEKHYGIQRDLRYISVFDKEDKKTEEKTREKDEEHLLKVKEQFVHVKDKEEITGILLHETSNIAKRVAVFLMRGEKFTPWKAKGLTVGNVEIDARASSVFSDVMNRKEYYRGPLLKIPGNEPLIKILGGTPQDCIMIPLYIREKLVAVLYADNGNAAVFDASLNYISTMVTLASLAFEIIIIRNKIYAL